MTSRALDRFADRYEHANHVRLAEGMVICIAADDRTHLERVVGMFADVWEAMKPTDRAEIIDLWTVRRRVYGMPLIEVVTADEMGPAHLQFFGGRCINARLTPGPDVLGIVGMEGLYVRLVDDYIDESSLHDLRSLIAHEFGHVAQWAEGTLTRDGAKGMTDEEIEDDADRRASLWRWGAPLPQTEASHA